MPGGKSHSWERPTSASRKPRAQAISVVLGSRETMRGGAISAYPNSGSGVAAPGLEIPLETLLEIPPAQIDALLGHWPVARLGTVAVDGRPHQVPVVFARTAEALWMPVDGKPKKGGELVRIANVRRDPRVSLLLDHYDADWQRLWWVRVDGEGSVVEIADPAEDREVAEAVQALRDKYPQYSDTPLFPGPATLIRVRPLRRRSWCPGPSAPAIPPDGGAG